MAFALGVATGGVAAGVVVLALRSGATGERSPAPTDPPAIAAGGAAVRLEARPQDGPPRAKGEGERFEAWYLDAAERSPDPQRVREVLWCCLVRAYAAARLGTDLERACDRAIEAGVKPSALLQVLREAGVSPDLPGLLARHRDADWDLRSRLEATKADDPAPLLEALRSLREALRARAAGGPAPGTPVGQPGIAEILQRLAGLDPARAAAEAEAVAEACPGDTGIAAQLAQGLRADPPTALRYVRRGLEGEPLDRNLLALFMDLDLPAATAHLEAALARDPESVEGWDALADARERAEDPRGAAEALARAAGIDPRTDRLGRLASLDPTKALPLIAAATEGPGAHDPDLWVLRAQVELRSGTVEEATEAWLRSLTETPDALRCDDTTAAWVALDPRRVADALAASVERAFATADEDRVRTYANALVEARDPRAFDVCRRAVQKGIWWGGMAEFLARADPAAALPLLEARRTAHPEDVEVLCGLGEAYLGTHRRAEAAAAYERVLSIAERERADYGDSAWVGLARADPEAGLARVREQAGRMARGPGAALLGATLAALGRTAEARAAWDRAIAVEPDNTLWRTRRAALR